MNLLGIDVGTTGTKAVLFDEQGAALGSGYREYPLMTPRPGYVTQSAPAWWEAAVGSVRDALEAAGTAEVGAIGLSTQGGSMTAVDREFRPLCDVMTWMDARAQREAAELGGAVGEERIYRTCGWPLNPSLDAAKIRWLKRWEPEVFTRAHLFVSTVEYLNYRLTGRCAVDPTNAAMHQLFDIRTGDWDGALLDAAGVERERLPEVLETGRPVGRLTPKAAEALGLSQSVMVYSGAHDQYCAALGSGAVRPGVMLLATRTAGVGRGGSEQLLYTDSHICPGIHPAGGYGAMASIVTAGSALKWLKGIVGGDYRTLDQGAEHRMESARDLFFYPYLAGAGFPHNDPNRRGRIEGLALEHDRYDLALSLMEGVVFETNLVLRAFGEQGMPVKKLIMTGGAAKSGLWSRLVAYVTGCQVFRMEQPETCCAGAAIIAGVGAGVFPSYREAAAAMARMTPVEADDRTLKAFYRDKAERYYGQKA